MVLILVVYSWFLVHPVSKTHWRHDSSSSSAASSTSSQLMPIFPEIFFDDNVIKKDLGGKWASAGTRLTELERCRHDIFPVLSQSTWPPPETLGFPCESLSQKSIVIHSWKMSRCSLLFLFIYYAALLPRWGPHIALHSVCPSVCPSVPLSLTSVTSRHLAN